MTARQTFEVGESRPLHGPELTALLGPRAVRVDVKARERTEGATTVISVGFPVLYVAGFVQEPDRFAVAVASRLSQPAPDKLLALARRVAGLNAAAGEIGAGMLAQLVAEAGRAVAEWTEASS